jgi:hypothetical protein
MAFMPGFLILPFHFSLSTHFFSLSAFRIMKNLILVLLSLLLFSGNFFLCLQAQTPGQKVAEWYLEERFLLADRNEDARLSPEELAAFPGEFVYYRLDQHFAAADQNQDGHLTFQEMKSRTRTENSYRYQQEQRRLRNLAREYPMLAQADKRYLEARPELVKELFSNLIWMYQHAELAEKLYRDRSFVQQHPEVLQALHLNLRWLAANPGEARQLYRNRETTESLPQLLGWRANHIHFMREQPPANDYLQPAFLPDGIRLQRP